MVRQLASAGCDINALSSSGQSALHIASKAGSSKTLLALLREGCDPYIIDNGGNAALDIAKKYRKWGCVDLLLNYASGSDTDIDDIRSNVNVDAKRTFDSGIFSCSIGTFKRTISVETDPLTHANPKELSSKQTTGKFKDSLKSRREVGSCKDAATETEKVQNFLKPHTDVNVSPAFPVPRPSLSADFERSDEFPRSGEEVLTLVAVPEAGGRESYSDCSTRLKDGIGEEEHELIQSNTALPKLEDLVNDSDTTECDPEILALLKQSDGVEATQENELDNPPWWRVVDLNDVCSLKNHVDLLSRFRSNGNCRDASWKENVNK